MGQWEVLIYRRLQHYYQRVAPTVLSDHRAILGSLRSRDLAAITALHAAINRRVSAEIKEALYVSPAYPAGDIAAGGDQSPTANHEV